MKNKRILIVTTEIVMLDEYIVAAHQNNDYIEVLLIGSNKSYHNKYLGKLHRVEKLVLPIIFTMFEGKVFDYVFTYDEKLLNIINIIAQKVKATNYNLTGKYSRDKYELKKLLSLASIKVPHSIKFENQNDLQNIDKNIKMPLIVKPTSGFGSNGVKLVQNWDDLSRQVNNVIRLNKLQKMNLSDDRTAGIVEEYVPDEEYAIEIIWHNFKPIAKGIMSRFHDSNNSFFPDYVYYTDINLNSKRVNELYEIAIKVGQALNIENGATHTEIRYNKNIPFVLENAVRPGGGGYLYKLFSQQQNIDFLQLYYNVMTGSKINDIKHRDYSDYNKKYYFLYSYPNRKTGYIKDIYFREKNISKEIDILSIDIFLQKGNKIIPNEFGMRYSFFVLGSMDTSTISDFKNGIINIEENCIIEFSSIL